MANRMIKVTQPKGPQDDHLPHVSEREANKVVSNYVPLFKANANPLPEPLMSKKDFELTSLGRMSKGLYTEILFYIPVQNESIDNIHSALVAIQKSLKPMRQKRNKFKDIIDVDISNRKFKSVVVIMYESWGKFIKQYKQVTFRKYFRLFVDLYKMKVAMNNGLAINNTLLERDLDILHCFCVKTDMRELVNNPEKLKVIFCIKNKKGGRLHSHQWLFNGLCNLITPTFVQMMIPRSKPVKDGLVNLYSEILRDNTLGAVTGKVIPYNSSPFNPITAAQDLEYKFKNLFDYRLESNLGYLTYLPQDFTCLRWVSIKGQPLQEHYFKALSFFDEEDKRKAEVRKKIQEAKNKADEEIREAKARRGVDEESKAEEDKNNLAEDKEVQGIENNEIKEIKYKWYREISKLNEELKTKDFGLIKSNFYYNIERVLPFTIFLSNKDKGDKEISGNLIKFVPSASCMVQVPSDMHEFLITRRADINGSWFSTLFFFKNLNLITSAGNLNCLFFTLELFWSLLNFIFQWFLVGIFGLSFSIILRDSFPEISQKSFNVLDFIIIAYYGFLINTLIVSIASTSRESSSYFEVSSAIYALAIIATIGMFIYGHLDLEFETQWMGLLILFTGCIFIIFLFIYGELDRRMVFYTLPFILMVPTYVNILFVYSICNTQICSRGKFKGTKPEEEQMTMRSKGRALMIFVWLVSNYMFVYLLEKANKKFDEKSYYFSYLFTAIAFFLLISRILSTFMFTIGSCLNCFCYALFKPRRKKRRSMENNREIILPNREQGE
jgi:hypothetical protein